MAQQRELLQITWLSQTEAGRTQGGGGSGYWAKDRVKRRTALRLETCAKVWRSPMVLQGGVRSSYQGPGSTFRLQRCIEVRSSPQVLQGGAAQPWSALRLLRVAQGAGNLRRGLLRLRC